MAYYVRMDEIEHLDFEPGEEDEPLGEDADGPPKSTVPMSPAQQDSNIPLGWKPTAKAPVPVMRCTQIKKDGVRCGRLSLRGYHKCVKHAGPGAKMENGNVNVYREAIIESAKLRLLDEVDPALDGLVALAQPGTAEQIRLKAYTEILDRAGIRGGFELSVEGEITVSSTDEIRKRLASLKEGADEVRKMREELHPAADAGDIVDGEVIEDSEQMTLFDELDESRDEQ